MRDSTWAICVLNEVADANANQEKEKGEAQEATKGVRKSKLKAIF